MKPETAEILRRPFPDDQVGKLPRGGRDVDFIAHSWITDRLLDADPDWEWQPFATDEDGLPKVIYGDRDSVLWIRLTIDGTTKPGVGIVSSKADDLEKQLISDALKNAAMRFGCGLQVWQRHPDDAVQERSERVSRPRSGSRQSAPKCAGCDGSDGSFVRKKGAYWHADCYEARESAVPGEETKEEGA